MKLIRYPRIIPTSPVTRASAGLVLGLTVTLATVAAPTPEQLEFFEQKVRPLLANHCYSCHSAETKPAGGLRVDDHNGLLTGGNTGPAIVPGDPKKSLLLQRVKHSEERRRMPKESDALNETQIADLERWIVDGAVWPPERLPSAITRLPVDYPNLKSNHWAWQPLTKPTVPSVRQGDWPVGDIDRFVLAKLEATKLKPVADADRATLIRRITFDLTGLPPKPEAIKAFEKDKRPDAYAKLVDELLLSRSFAERWGRHWLDVGRYGESTGPSRNIPYPHAWRYRDYVLDAVGRDVPFDQFIREQVAGDLLPALSESERDRLSTATGFLALGAKDVNQRFKVRFQMDNVDEKIDTVSRSVLGLTVSCARCHNHKFDPIPATDYYALAGIFTSTEDGAGVRNKMGGGGLDYYDAAALVKLATNSLPPVPMEKVKELQAKTDAAKEAWDAIRGTPEGLKPDASGRPTQRPFRLKYEKLQAELLSLTDPAARGGAVHGVRDAATIADTEFRIRGEAERLGPTVARGFLTVFEVPGASVIPTNSSGRLQLAEWLTSPENPLTSRVIVNRIWAHLFGVGIVNTVDNFGVNGDVPSHPELLDYLASEFQRGGWSVKGLIRTIALSRAYRLSAESSEQHEKIDPANRLVWRHAPRRLDAEEIRDTVLATAGRLKVAETNISAANELRMVELRDNGPEARRLQEQADRDLRRSVYLPLLRGVTPRALEAFDPVSQSLVTGKRENTTIPTQALFLLNSSFVRENALAFAERILAEEKASERERITHAYQIALGRTPSRQEISRARDFLKLQAANHVVTAVVDRSEVKAEPETKPVKETPEPANPDDIDRTETVIAEADIAPRTAQLAAWMSFVQSIYASGEFRFVR